ncbi:MAG TPA: hypothetical protein QF870_03700, partial [Nitrospinota bacterium]|nr:hypothetical protein [Nitrospinota bacterium]
PVNSIPGASSGAIRLPMEKLILEEGGQDARPTRLNAAAFHQPVGRASCPAGRDNSDLEP